MSCKQVNTIENCSIYRHCWKVSSLSFLQYNECFQKNLWNFTCSKVGACGKSIFVNMNKSWMAWVLISLLEIGRPYVCAWTEINMQQSWQNLSLNVRFEINGKYWTLRMVADSVCTGNTCEKQLYLSCLPVCIWCWNNQWKSVQVSEIYTFGI